MAKVVIRYCVTACFGRCASCASPSTVADLGIKTPGCHRWCMGRTGEKVWNKTWRIITTVLIAVVIPPGMAAWLVGYGWISGLLNNLMWNLSYWAPGWVAGIFFYAVTVLWFGLPWVVVVWLLLKIWRNSRYRPRITEGKG